MVNKKVGENRSCSFPQRRDGRCRAGREATNSPSTALLKPINFLACRDSKPWTLDRVHNNIHWIWDYFDHIGGDLQDRTGPLDMVSENSTNIEKMALFWCKPLHYEASSANHGMSNAVSIRSSSPRPSFPYHFKNNR